MCPTSGGLYSDVLRPDIAEMRECMTMHDVSTSPTPRQAVAPTDLSFFFRVPFCIFFFVRSVWRETL